ncbi:TadE family protein [Mariniblastus fucicola]|nr:TadE family protein [Mariniblastus fucicola]
MKKTRALTSNKNNTRRGAAVAELAVCLPMFLLVLTATLDICGMFYVQQTLKISAYEGARVGIVPESESENVVFQCENLLDAQGVKGYSIVLDPPDPQTLTVGDYFTVTVEADYAQNAIAGSLYPGKLLTKSVTLRVE